MFLILICHEGRIFKINFKNFLIFRLMKNVQMQVKFLEKQMS